MFKEINKKAAVLTLLTLLAMLVPVVIMALLPGSSVYVFIACAVCGVTLYLYSLFDMLTQR